MQWKFSWPLFTMTPPILYCPCLYSSFKSRRYKSAANVCSFQLRPAHWTTTTSFNTKINILKIILFQQKIQLNLSLWANLNEERKKFKQVVNKLFPRQENKEYYQCCWKIEMYLISYHFSAKMADKSWQESEIH